MFARISLLAATVLSQASALSLHSQKQASTDVPTVPPTYNKHGELLDPGTLVYTNGDEEHAHLPDVYGDGPRILGLNHCAAYRASVPQGQRKWAAAGMPNTGTNALFNLMKNCNSDESGLFNHHRYNGWQVPWGKHNFRNPTPTVPKTLAVVLVKDPVQWMASTCRHSYFSVHKDALHCPSPVNETQLDYFDGKRYNNLMDVWGTWYQAYFQNDKPANQRDFPKNMEPTQPALMIRFEDLLFKPEDTISQVCECLGFKAKAGKDFKILESVGKFGTGHGQPTNRSETILHYTSKRDALLSRITEADEEYMKRSFGEKGGGQVADYFHYTILRGASQPYPSGAHDLLQSENTAELLARPDWGDDE